MKSRRDGEYRRAGLSQDEIEQRLQEDLQSDMDEEQLRIRAGRDYRKTQGVSALVPPGYQSRGRMLLSDGQHRSYVPVGTSEPTMAFCYVDIAETRKRNESREAPVEFPMVGDRLVLKSLLKTQDDVDTRQWSVQVLSVMVPPGRTASATVEFSQAVPQRSELESAAQAERRELRLQSAVHRREQKLG